MASFHSTVDGALNNFTLPTSEISHANLNHRSGQAWFCTTGLPSDVSVAVDEMVFHLHKFPLISRSGKLCTLIKEAAGEAIGCVDGDGRKEVVLAIRLEDMPGGPDAFEQAAKFCYGAKMELSAANVAALRCASEHLQMTEEYGEKNLISLTESFLNTVVLRSWKDSITVLRRCDDLLPLAEKLSIVKRCCRSIAMKLVMNPELSAQNSTLLHSPDGTLLWNGISTGARPKYAVLTDWWYDDIAELSLPLFRKVIGSMQETGIRAETLARLVMHYAMKHIPGLNRRQASPSTIMAGASGRPALPSARVSSESDQTLLLEEIESILPTDHGSVSTPFLFGMLKVSMILGSSKLCRHNLERRIGAQLEQAALDDLLIPNYTSSLDTLYDVDCAQRLMEEFLQSQKITALGDEASGLRCEDGNNDNEAQLLSALRLRDVAKLLDEYLAEIGPDTNLKANRFRAMAECLPHYARGLDDGLYRAIDIFIKERPWMSKEEREDLWSVMDCRKLSLEACTHAAQNEGLPLRVVMQVLFVEQMHLRVAIMGCLDGTVCRPSGATLDSHEDAEMSPQGGHGAQRSSSYNRESLGMLLGIEGRGTDVTLSTELLNVSNHPGSIPEINTRKNGAPRQRCRRPSSFRENQDLQMDIVGLHRRINELEHECSDLHSRLHPKTSSWSVISSKLMCRSIADVSDVSRHRMPLSYSQARVARQAEHAHDARISLASSPSVMPLSSSSTQSYSPSSYMRGKQALQSSKC